MDQFERKLALGDVWSKLIECNDMLKNAGEDDLAKEVMTIEEKIMNIMLKFD